MSQKMSKLDNKIREMIHRIADEYYNLNNMTTGVMRDGYSIKIEIIKLGVGEKENENL